MQLLPQGTSIYKWKGKVEETKEYNNWIAQQITYTNFLAENSKEEKKIKLVKNN